MYKKSPEKFSLAGSSSNTPFQVFLSARGPKIAQIGQKLYISSFQLITQNM